METIIFEQDGAIIVIKKLYDDGYATTLQEGLALELQADTNLTNTNDQLTKFKGS